MPTKDAEYFRLKEVAVDYVQSKPAKDYEVKVRLILEQIYAKEQTQNRD